MKANNFSFVLFLIQKFSAQSAQRKHVGLRIGLLRIARNAPLGREFVIFGFSKGKNEGV